MLAKLTMASDALGEQLQPLSLMKAIHLNLLEALIAHGELIFRNGEEATQFIRAAKGGALPPDVAKRWDAALTTLHQRGRIKIMSPPDDRAISTGFALSELKDTWAGKIQVVVLGGETATKLGVPTDEGILEDEDAHIEVATVYTAGHTKAISHLRGLAESAVFPFETRDDFWHEVLGPVAEVSRSVTITDKYLFTDLWRRAKYPRKWRDSPAEHVSWLLENFDSSMRSSSNVHLISYTGEVEIKKTIDVVLDAWRPSKHGRLSSVKLTLVTKDHDFPHDRHMRFDSGVAIAVSAGFDRLRQPRIWDKHGMAWTYMYRPSDLKRLHDRELAALALDGESEYVVLR